MTYENVIKVVGYHMKFQDATVEATFGIRQDPIQLDYFFTVPVSSNNESG